MTTATETPTKPACCAASAKGRRIYSCDQCGRLCMDLEVTVNQAKFIYSQKKIVWGVGGAGEGKTFMALVSMLQHAASQPPQDPNPITGQPSPIQWGFIRDTHANLKRISAPAVKRMFPGIFSFHDDYHIMRAQGLEVQLFGMDRPDDLGRIQGAEFDGVWLEEPAPIIAQGPSGPVVNMGVNREVFTTSVHRMRGRNTRKRYQITMNPADRSHWTFYERELNPEWEGMKEIVRMRPGENPHYSEADRKTLQAAFADRPDLHKRYVLGIESEVYPGVSITPEYNPEWHKAAVELKPLLGCENFLMFDGGLNPTCVLGQLTPTGRFHIIDCVLVSGAGMRQLLTVKVIPLLNSPRWKRIKHSWRALGDESLNNREQSDSEFSGARMIDELLAPWLRTNAYEGGVQDWDLRREAIKTVLERNIGGLPALLINPVTTPGEPFHRVHAALAGGYCYKVTNGVVQRERPDKNIHCVDLDTEILTRRGWLRHEGLREGEVVYAYDLQKRRLRESKLLNVHRFPNAPLITFSGQNLEMAVTPNHRCIVDHRWKKGIRLVEAASLCASDFILRAAPYGGQRSRWFSNDFIQLCAWIMADGCYRSGRSGAITISQSMTVNEPYCQTIDRLVRRFGGRVHTDRPNCGFSRGTIRVWQLSGEMADLIQYVMPSKVPSAAFIHRMTNSQRRLFLYEMIRGDGTWETGECLPDPGGMRKSYDFFVRPTTPRIFQKDRAAIDALQVIATLAGIRASIRRKHWRTLFEGWSLSLTREGAWTSVNKLEKTIQPDAPVWCPETEHGTWVARRNGLVFITGNSHVGDSITHSFARLFGVPAMPMDRNEDERSRRRAEGYSVGVYIPGQGG